MSNPSDNLDQWRVTQMELLKSAVSGLGVLTEKVNSVNEKIIKLESFLEAHNHSERITENGKKIQEVGNRLTILETQSKTWAAAAAIVASLISSLIVALVVWGIKGS